MKSGFWKVCISLGMSEDLSRKSQWKTWKQMMEKYTESEVEEMVEHGSIKVQGKGLKHVSVSVASDCAEIDQAFEARQSTVRRPGRE
eukprot:2515435-Pyramimonas_sp.AAC.1